MFFLFDDQRKIAFAWSAKCGCTKVKMMFNFLAKNQRIPLNKIHQQTYNRFGERKPSEYRTVLFIRNPYKRLISGFLDKYFTAVPRLSLKQLTTSEISFSVFCDEIDRTGLTHIDNHHFTPQFSEAFRDDVRFEAVFDIESIDYSYLEKLYNKHLPEEMKVFKGKEPKVYSNYINSADKLTVDDLSKLDFTPSYDSFFSERTTEIVNRFYKKDFDEMEKYGHSFPRPDNR